MGVLRIVFAAAQLAVFAGVFLWLWFDEWETTGGNPDPGAAMGCTILGGLAVLAFSALAVGAEWLILWWRGRKLRNKPVARLVAEPPLTDFRRLVEKHPYELRLLRGVRRPEDLPEDWT